MRFGMKMNALSLILFGIIIPYFVGTLVTSKWSKDKDTFALNIVSGYMAFFGVLEILTLLCYKFEVSLSFLIMVFVYLFFGIAVCSTIYNRKRIAESFQKKIEYIKKHKVNGIMLLTIIIIFAQTYFVSTRQHIDDDDAFYIGTAETAVATDTIMKYDPSTGYEGKTSSRYVLSPFPIYHAVMGKLVGIKPVEYAHTIHPILMIPLGYMVMYLISTLLFEKERKYRGYFMLIMALINTFANYSVYSQGTFFMFRIWQGKAMLCAIILPAIMYFVLSVKDKMKISEWFMLLLVMLSACFVSSMGIILGVISLGCWGIAHLITTKNWKTTCIMGSCALPNMILLVIYMFIS